MGTSRDAEATLPIQQLAMDGTMVSAACSLLSGLHSGRMSQSRNVLVALCSGYTSFILLNFLWGRRVEVTSQMPEWDLLSL